MLKLRRDERGMILRFVMWYVLFVAALVVSLSAYVAGAGARFAGDPITDSHMRSRLLPAAVLFALSVLPLIWPGTSKRVQLLGLVYALTGAWLFWPVITPS
jgi:hypothetical protein